MKMLGEKIQGGSQKETPNFGGMERLKPQGCKLPVGKKILKGGRFIHTPLIRDREGTHTHAR